MQIIKQNSKQNLLFQTLSNHLLHDNYVFHDVPANRQRILSTDSTACAALYTSDNKSIF